MIDEGTNLFAEQEWPLEPCAGDTHTDPQGRLWTCCPIVYGAKSGRWAYRLMPEYPNILTVVIDTLQHLQSAQFQGMLALPWDGQAKLGWVLGRKWCSPVSVKLEFAPPFTTRFERLDTPPEED